MKGTIKGYFLLGQKAAALIHFSFYAVTSPTEFLIFLIAFESNRIALVDVIGWQMKALSLEKLDVQGI